ncbi:hypothetical protein DRQ36_05150 [bacterium]|nr:MAG: hypothetical protein DRQ36_05150 [bacterium]
MEVRESQIETVLVSTPALSRQILGLTDEPRILARQMILPSGRLDLLYTYRKNLLLVELKVVPFRKAFLTQVLNYKSDLTDLQTQGRLIQGEIQPFLACIRSTEHQRKAASSRGITCVNYDPAQVLHVFYSNLKPIAFFTQTKPIDIGIWNIHLIHEMLYLLGATNSVKTLQNRISISSRTLYNKIRFATELRLVNWEPNQDEISLSNLGEQYVNRKDIDLPERLSEGQVSLLRGFIVKNPYESPVILGIASVVEAVFTLSKNTYPVPMHHLIEYFTYHAGKYFDWQTPKAKYSATRMYSNYAIDLGLIAKSGETVYLTPDGFRFTMQMQLHKGLKMIEGVSFE